MQYSKGRLGECHHLSINETAKENRLNPNAYLNHLFETLPNLGSRDDASLEALLRRNVNLL